MLRQYFAAPSFGPGASGAGLALAGFFLCRIQFGRRMVGGLCWRYQMLFAKADQMGFAHTFQRFP